VAFDSRRKAATTGRRSIVSGRLVRRANAGLITRSDIVIDSARPRSEGRVIGHLKSHVRVNHALRAFRSRRHPIFHQIEKSEPERKAAGQYQPRVTSEPGRNLIL